MVRKELGKIKSAEFGMVRDRPFLFGLQLTFSMGGSGVGDGGVYTVNLSPECKWERMYDRVITVTKIIDDTNKILSDAKVNYVSQLTNKPVEVTLDGNCFKEFRILTEVL